MWRYSWLKSVALALLLFPAWVSAEGVVVVANLDEPIKLSREQVRNLYMGASLGQQLTPIALTPSNRLRLIFNTQVIGLSESRIQSYWAQMRFTGRSRPPQEVENEDDLLRELLSQPRTVGYWPASMPVPERLVVVYDGS